MDLLNDNIGKLYKKYFVAAFGSTLIMSIYSLVDTIVIGQYAGPDGTAAVVTFAPMWNILFAFGLLFGIGGSVIMAQKRGAGDSESGNNYFSSSLTAAIVTSVLLFAVYNLFGRQLLAFCGGEGQVLEYALDYAFWISLTAPLFVIGQVLVPFIRNDGRPLLTTVAVMSGGVFNIFGDIFFVFVCDMGVGGAGLATAIGQLICVLILLSHFFGKKCGLRYSLRRSLAGFGARLGRIILMGGSNFVIDIAMGVMTVMFNNQIMRYSNASGLAVYGVINTLTTTAQTFGYAVGESAQAVMSPNFGAGKYKRVNETFKYAAIASVIIGAVCFAAGELFPKFFIRLYMKPTEEVLAIVPTIFRKYLICLLIMVFNVFTTYYFQSISKPVISLAVSVMRGALVNAVFVYTLPAIFGADAMWFTMPLTELVVLAYVLLRLKRTWLTEKTR